MEEKSKEENLEQPASNNKNKIKVGKILKISWKVLEKLIMILIVFVSLIIVTQRISDNDKAFLGYRIFRVQTGSMIPVYNVGDVIFVKEKDINKIKIGEDVTYWGTTGVMKGKLVTHRVIGIEEIDGKKAFHTQGVANTAEDPIVYAEQINGIVKGKSYLLTGMTHALANQYVFYFCAIIPLTIIVFFTFVRGNVRKFEDKD